MSKWPQNSVNEPAATRHPEAQHKICNSARKLWRSGSIAHLHRNLEFSPINSPTTISSLKLLGEVLPGTGLRHPPMLEHSAPAARTLLCVVMATLSGPNVICPGSWPACLCMCDWPDHILWVGSWQTCEKGSSSHSRDLVCTSFDRCYRLDLYLACINTLPRFGFLGDRHDIWHRAPRHGTCNDALWCRIARNRKNVQKAQPFSSPSMASQTGRRPRL